MQSYLYITVLFVVREQKNTPRQSYPHAANPNTTFTFVELVSCKVVIHNVLSIHHPRGAIRAHLLECKHSDSFRLIIILRSSLFIIH